MADPRVFLKAAFGAGSVVMRPAARLRVGVAGLACGLYGLFAATVYVKYFSAHFAQDWMVYYGAARAYLDGNLLLVLDGERFTAYLNQAFAQRLPQTLSFHPWLYPPPFLLLLIPFALLPFEAACALFLLATFVLLLLVLWRITGPGFRPWLHGLSLLLAPASGFTIGSGQNGFLTAALLVGGFGFLPRQPRLAGVLLGLLTYKPQFWLLVPIALAAGRQWRVLTTAVITASLMALVSLAVLGIEPWRVWIEWMIHPPAAAYREWVVAGRLQGESLHTNLVLLGASDALASFGQCVGFITAAGCVWWAYRRAVPADLQLAMLLGSAMLAAPHVGPYDAVLLVIAATILFARASEEGFRPGELIVLMLVWMIQLFNPPGAFPIGLITPVLTVLLIAYAITRAHAALGFRPDLPDAVSPVAAR
jgi:alpha-1,2-mannosyltransferase